MRIVQESIQTGPPSWEWLEVTSCVAATRPERIRSLSPTDTHARESGERSPVEDFS
jgi:hypothetical protein